MNNMDLDQASQAHATWKVKLRAAIAKKETLDAATIAKDNCCPLGQWLHGDAKARFGRWASYTECVTRHAGFHREAGAVAHLINAGAYAQAEAALNAGTPYAAASGQVASAILGLKKEAALQAVAL